MAQDRVGALQVRFAEFRDELPGLFQDGIANGMTRGKRQGAQEALDLVEVLFGQMQRDMDATLVELRKLATVAIEDDEPVSDKSDSIDDLDLRPHSWTLLKRGNVPTISQLVTMTDADLKQLGRCGTGILGDIDLMLKEKGYPARPKK